jgi:hypothetical protein
MDRCVLRVCPRREATLCQGKPLKTHCASPVQRILQARDESFVGIVLISVIRGADKLLKAFGVDDLVQSGKSANLKYGATPRFDI